MFFKKKTPDELSQVVKSMQPRAFENVSFSRLTSWVPSGDYLRSVYLSSQETCLPGASHSKVDYQRLRMSMVAGEYLCIDDNFQLPKYIRDSDGTPLFTAMTTVMNEYNEVCARYLKPDQSYKTVMGALGLVAKRYDKEGVKVRLGRSVCCQHELQCSHAFYDLVTTYVLP